MISSTAKILTTVTNAPRPPNLNRWNHADHKIKTEIRTRKFKFINIIYKSKLKESIKLV